MFLSIIIPVYNAEKYLRECLDSCLAQNYPKDDYEILCIDDGSTDRSGDILERYAAENVNVTVIKKENGGVSSARNLGLEHAKGDYIWFVDADDYIEQTSLWAIKKAADESFADRIRIEGRTFSLDVAEEKVFNLVLQCDDNVVTQNVLKAEPILTNNIRFDTNCSYGEDTLFLFDAINRYRNKKDVQSIFYNVRMHNASATKKNDINKRIEMVRSYFYVGKRMKMVYESENSTSEKRQFTADQMLMVMRKGLEVLATLPNEEFKRILKELTDSGLYPVKMVSECTYTWHECVNENSGTGKVRNFLRYYSIYPWGLYLSTVPYKVSRMKIKLSRTLRSNDSMKKLLDAKNQLLRR